MFHREDMSYTKQKSPSDLVCELSSSVWVEIKGYKNRYRLSDYGIVQSLNATTGEWRTLSVYLVNGKRATVALIDKKGKKQHVYVADLMAEYFMGGRKNHPGMVLYHKNKCKLDCSKRNLEWLTKSECCKRTGGSYTRPVVKLDKHGTIIEFFSSCKKCCEHEFISRAALYRILHGQVSDPFKLTGYTYRYERVRE